MVGVQTTRSAQPSALARTKVASEAIDATLEALETRAQPFIYEAPTSRLDFQWAWIYDKVSATGEHLKYGLTNNLAQRYSASKLAGGSLRVLAGGARAEQRALERYLHSTLPLGPEEGQAYYQQLQKDK
jgi:hypothetical protein